MAITVKIPSQLRAATGGEGELEVEGGTVGEALDAVFDQHDGLRERITQDGDLRRFVNVYVSGEDIRFQDGLETAINDGDEVTILPAVAGGARTRPLAAAAVVQVKDSAGNQVLNGIRGEVDRLLARESRARRPTRSASRSR